MPSPSRSRRFFSLLSIVVFSVTLTGCDEAYVNSRQEAESYKQSHPQLPGNKIFIQQSNGSEVTLDDLEDADPVTQSPPEVETGEVLKYEDTATGTPVELFSVNSIMEVFNGGASPTFKLEKASRLTEVSDYHWNSTKGKAPGTISLKDGNGKTYGPWQASSSPGQGGVLNAYWNVTPNIDLPAGSYTIIDSDPATWSQNTDTKGQGMTWVKGYEIK